jgi:hypothetical protein
MCCRTSSLLTYTGAAEEFPAKLFRRCSTLCAASRWRIGS